MYSYSIYTHISHLNQLINLYPKLISRIKEEIDGICTANGGEYAGEWQYVFNFSLEENKRRTLDAAEKIYSNLLEYKNQLYGISVILFSPKSEQDRKSGYKALLLKVPEENFLWLPAEIADDFRKYAVFESAEDLLKIRKFKQTGPRLEERLPKMLIRIDKLMQVERSIRRIIERNSDYYLLLSGNAGSGKRSTLQEVLKQFNAESIRDILFISLTGSSGDTVEPVIRSVKRIPSWAGSALNKSEKLWWENTGRELLNKIIREGPWKLCLDQGSIDIIQSYILFIKSYIREKTKKDLPAFIVIEGLTDETDIYSWIKLTFKELYSIGNVVPVLIADSENISSGSSFPGSAVEVKFDNPDINSIKTIIKEAGNFSCSVSEAEHLLKNSGSSIYKLFHSLLAKEKSITAGPDAGKALLDLLDSDTKELYFLVSVSGLLSDRHLLISRNGEDDFQNAENSRYYDLVNLGFIRESSDGTVYSVPGGPEEDAIENTEYSSAAELYGLFLYNKYTEGYPLNLLRLFSFLEEWGPAAKAVDILDKVFDYLFTWKRYSLIVEFFERNLFINRELNAETQKALRNILEASRLRFILLTGSAGDLSELIKQGDYSLLLKPSGLFSDKYILQLSSVYYAIGRLEDSLNYVKESLFSFQKNGNHTGETFAHIQLAEILLASGKVMDALEHFRIAGRIGIQVSEECGILRASAMEGIALFLLGNLSGALREALKFRRESFKLGRRDLWLLLSLLVLRIKTEYGLYREAAEIAEESCRTADFYGLKNEYKVFRLWHGRALALNGEKAGREILLENMDSREALFFLSEIYFINGETEKALKFIKAAAAEERVCTALQQESEDWSDGYYPIEGRLLSAGEPLDVLGTNIKAFRCFLSGINGSADEYNNLIAFSENKSGRFPVPYNYYYALWSVLVTPENQMETQTRLISRAFNSLQFRAGRFDDNQEKHLWLSENYWNAKVMEEAQKRKFL